jgi:hypothetical protein
MDELKHPYFLSSWCLTIKNGAANPDPKYKVIIASNRHLFSTENGIFCWERKQEKLNLKLFNFIDQKISAKNILKTKIHILHNQVHIQLDDKKYLALLKSGKF